MNVQAVENLWLGKNSELRKKKAARVEQIVYFVIYLLDGCAGRYHRMDLI